MRIGEDICPLNIMFRWMVHSVIRGSPLPPNKITSLEEYYKMLMWWILIILWPGDRDAEPAVGWWYSAWNVLVLYERDTFCIIKMEKSVPVYVGVNGTMLYGLSVNSFLAEKLAFSGIIIVSIDEADFATNCVEENRSTTLIIIVIRDLVPGTINANDRSERRVASGSVLRDGNFDVFHWIPGCFWRKGFGLEHHANYRAALRCVSVAALGEHCRGSQDAAPLSLISCSE